MKSILTLIIICALCVTGQASTNAVLRGIRIVETQDQLHPPRGKLGERGPYQFRRSTWRMHTSSHFDLSENREVANTVAKRHYAWIQAQLRSNGIASSAYNVALAWNAGVNAVIRGSAPAVAHDYASRVINIVGSTPPEETAQPAEQAPMLAADEPPAKPSPSPALEIVLTPVPEVATPVVNVAADTASDPSNPHEVRYYGNPILLALNRSIPPEPVAQATVAPLDLTTNTLFASTVPQTIGRM